MVKQLSLFEKRNNVNQDLSFEHLKESERTKHVHRLHPYKGKFIPQLVEHFLKSYFKEGDIVLDPFCGSETTLVQANELGLHAVGIELASFSALISEVKIAKHNLALIEKIASELTLKLREFQKDKKNLAFEEELHKELSKFNQKYFPPSDKRLFQINEEEYGKEKEREFLLVHQKLVQEYKLKVKQEKEETFLDVWFTEPVRKELDFLAQHIKSIADQDVKKVLMLILSRTARSCRATTHADLTTLKKPVFTPYYCRKHGRICSPIFSVNKWWEFYVKDTIKRLREFERLRTDTFQVCIQGDVKTVDIYEEVKRINPELAEIIAEQKIRGIFTSPPYVGFIDYHQQHAYAYELFELERKDELEIGSMRKGQSKKQKQAYIEDIAKVLLNCKKYLQEDYDVFLVVNDKFNLYPEIARLAGMKIVKEFKRPVLCRAEKNRQEPYTEVVLHLKEK